MKARFFGVLSPRRNIMAWEKRQKENYKDLCLKSSLQLSVSLSAKKYYHTFSLLIFSVQGVNSRGYFALISRVIKPNHRSLVPSNWGPKKCHGNIQEVTLALKIRAQQVLQWPEADKERVYRGFGLR